jgi:hypothetical protein
MRNFFIALIILKSATGFGQSADFFVEDPLHKFPKTNEGAVLEHTYLVQNKGDQPLIISDYKVACPCTKLILPDTIMPGQQAEIVLTFDTKGKYYQQDRRIFLVTNTPKKMEELRFKVYVIPKDEQ